MSGIRLGARAVVVTSPPFSAYEDATLDGDVNIYRRRRTDAPGDATKYTDYDDGGTTTEAMHNPVLSPDGSKIAYTQHEAVNNLGELWVVDNVPGSTPVQLVADATRWINTPMWSPDSSKIVFTRANAAGLIYGGIVESVPAAGGSPTVLYTPASGYRAFRPAYNFDGSRIAFMLTDLASTDDGLWTMDDDGANAVEIAAITGYRLDGSQFGWANGADKLAYEDGATLAEVRVINGNGTGSTKINTQDTDLSSCRVSKFCWPDDDSFVVIVSNQGAGFWSLYRCEVDGSGDTLLNAIHGSANQGWMKAALVYRERIWFIETASSGGGGRIGSVALDGTDYVEELDVNDAAILDPFAGGNGFEYQ